MQPIMVSPDTRRVVHLRISGRVQGVWYRPWSVQNAISLGLDGWVRNRRDGTVELLLAGPASEVERMIERCGQGPTHAWVDHVAVDEATECGFVGFTTRPTL